jgi:hypothetical protein
MYRLLLGGLLSWLAMLGLDFFLHGGLLAAFWVQNSPFLLPPAQAFLRIPMGYAACLLLAGLLRLMRGLGIAGGGGGASFSACMGDRAGRGTGPRHPCLAECQPGAHRAGVTPPHRGSPVPCSLRLYPPGRGPVKQ